MFERKSLLFMRQDCREGNRSGDWSAKSGPWPIVCDLRPTHILRCLPRQTHEHERETCTNPQI